MTRRPKFYICNAFSLSMLDRQGIEDGKTGVKRTPMPLSLERAREICANPDVEIISAVGHTDTAMVFMEQLKIGLRVQRIAVKLKDSDEHVIVGQLMRHDGKGYRLPEGTTDLPPDATIEWWLA